MKEFDKGFGDVAHTMFVGIAINEGDWIFDPDGFVGHDQFVGTAAVDPRQQFIFVGHDHIAYSTFERRHGFAAALIHDLDVLLNPLQKSGCVVIRRSGARRLPDRSASFSPAP